MRPSLATLLASLCLFTAGSALGAPTTKKAPAKPEPPPLPAPSVRLSVVAPTLRGPWIVRIDNEGTIPVRVPADARLLKFEIETGEKEKPTTCVAPKTLRPAAFPENRALLLGPGQSYIETFDPYLYCFGKAAAALRPNALVHASLGWDPPKKQGKKPPTGPFAVETTEREATVASLVMIQAPSILLGSDTAPAAPNAPNAPPATETKDPKEGSANTTEKPIVDERAGRLVLTTAPFLDASGPRGVTMSAVAKNDGLRPITVALRPWMLSFRVEGPYGHITNCEGSPPRGLPADAFGKISAGGSSTLSVMLAEVCPRNTFPRPGIYRITTTLSAGETTSGVDAYTAEISTKEPTVVRLVDGPQPFHLEAPRPVPAAAPAPAEPDDATKETSPADVKDKP